MTRSPSSSCTGSCTCSAWTTPSRRRPPPCSAASASCWAGSTSCERAEGERTNVAVQQLLMVAAEGGGPRERAEGDRTNVAAQHHLMVADEGGGPMSSADLAVLAVIIILIALSGFFALSETALTRTNKIRAIALDEEGGD